MTGNYLTTPGRGAVKDREMLGELGLKAVGITQSDEAPEHVRNLAAARPLPVEDHARKYHRLPGTKSARLAVLDG